MVEILLGHQHKQEPYPEWSKTIHGQLLYIHQKDGLLWIRLPKEREGLDHAGLQLGGDQPLLLGSLEPVATDGCLEFFQLEQPQLARINADKQLEPLTMDPSTALPETIRLNQSLHEYVQGDEPNSDILRSIAWYASTQIAEIKSNLSRALHSFTFDDLVKHHPAYVRRPIARCLHLFEELRRAVEARHLVFILGGTKSGLSSFLHQFTSVITAEKCYVSAAEFNPNVFKDIQSYLGSINQRGLVARLGCDSDTASLFIALAYAGYKGLLKGSEIDSTKLAAFVPMTAADHTDDFVLQYISRSARYRTRVVEAGSRGLQVESFLLFLGELMAAAGRASTLTIVLSFPGLTNWLREIRGEEIATRISWSLWEELTSFTLANYDTNTGQPKPRSVMAEYKYNVGVIVELQRLSFPDISEAFCRQAVLIMPPFSDEELMTLWRQRMQTVPTPRVLELIRYQTGGAPWFVDFLMDCFDNVWPISSQSTEEETLKRLEAAAEFAKGIIINQPGSTTQPKVQELRQRWTLYVEDLASRMSAQTRTDRTTLLRLMNASGMREQEMPSNVPATEWLESGLIWLRNPTRKHTLTAFASYPFVHTFPQSELIGLLIRSLTTARPRMEKVS